MKESAAAGFAAALALGAACWSAPRPADDVSLRMRVGDGATAGPLARLTLRNRGTNAQSGVTVEIFAESETGLLLWSGTADLAPGESTVIVQRVWLDADTTALVARATAPGGPDEDPTNDASRVGLGFHGRRARAVVGRAVHLARCASCHGDEAGGGSGPALAGAPPAAVLAKAAAGGDHDFPWLSKADARDLSFFFRDPAGVVLPPSLPTPPAGGWPTYAGDVKPLLDGRCTGCHGGGSADGGIRLHTYATASSNARRSLTAVRSGRMPQGGKKFSPTEVALLDDWITGGRRP